MMKTLRSFLSLLFPRRCIVCGKEADVSLSMPFCPLCYEAYEKEVADGCPSCSKPFSHCRCRPSGLSKIPFYYALPYNREGGAVRAVILQNKYHKQQAVLDDIASRMAHLLHEHEIPTEDLLISYIPRSPRRRRSIKLDQAEELARALANELKRPCLRLLSCRASAKEQKTLSAKKRWLQANQNYRVAFGQGHRLIGQRILLIDDIVTTGATLLSCYSLLLEAGAKEVICLAAARTLPESTSGPLY